MRGRLASTQVASRTPLRRRDAPSSALDTPAASRTNATFSSGDQSCALEAASGPVDRVAFGNGSLTIDRRWSDVIYVREWT